MKRLSHFLRAVRSTLRPAPATMADRDAYRAWAARHAPTDADLRRMQEASALLAHQPLVSVITPVHDTDPRWLRACIESVVRQAYPRWELCLCDDASTSAATLEVLNDLRDPRIKLRRLAANAHISAASNAALALATGDFVALLDHDDELTPDALFAVVRHLNQHPETDIVYSDEDKIDPDEGWSEPYFKPDWSSDHLLGAMYTCHLAVIRRSLVERASGFREGYEGSQDHDLMLRLSESTSKIHHLPRVLYHWRRTPQSVAMTGAEKPWAHEAGMRAVQDALRRRGVEATVSSGGLPGLYRPRFTIASPPLVSIVATGAGGAAAVERLRARTAGVPIEILEAGIRTDEIQRAVRSSRGAHVALVSLALEPAADDWLSALVEFSMQPEIGAAGAKLFDDGGRLRHIGLLLGVGAGVTAPMQGAPGQAYGYFSSAVGIRNYSALSGDCIATRRETIERVGGFDERLPWSAAAVDYCLRTRQSGLRVVFTPYATLSMRGTAPPVDALDEEAIRALRSRWPEWFERDPAYNVNLSRRAAYALREDAAGSRLEP